MPNSLKQANGCQFWITWTLLWNQT